MKKYLIIVVLIGIISILSNPINYIKKIALGEDLEFNKILLSALDSVQGNTGNSHRIS